MVIKNIYYALLILFFTNYSFVYATPKDVAFPDQGEWLTIKANNKQCPVVYIPALSKRRGALIIIQGIEERRFERDILKYLRYQLPENGWSTLGINIPNSKANTDVIDPSKQLEQAVALLQKAGNRVIYILLYGEDSAKLLSYFINNKVRNINGIIFLSSYSKKRSNYNLLVKNIKTWRMFIFDIKAQYDYHNVETNLKLRDKIFDEVPGYHRDLTILGAAHDYMDSKKVLMKWIRGWMLRYSYKSPIVNRPTNLHQIPLN